MFARGTLFIRPDTYWTAQLPLYLFCDAPDISYEMVQITTLFHKIADICNTGTRALL